MYDNLRKLAQNTGGFQDKVKHELSRAAMSAYGTLTDIPGAIQNYHQLNKTLRPSKKSRLVASLTTEPGITFPLLVDFRRRHAAYGPYRSQ